MGKTNIKNILNCYKSFVQNNRQKKILFFFPLLSSKKIKKILFSTNIKYNKKKINKLTFIANKQLAIENLKGRKNNTLFKNYKLEKLSYRKKKIKNIIHIKISPNNTIITLSDKKGNLIQSFSAGLLGLHSSKKNYKLIHQLVLNDVLFRLKKERKKKNIQFKFNVPKILRRRLIKRLRFYFKNKNIFEGLRQLPFNGCRPPKTRRKKRKGLRILKPKI